MPHIARKHVCTVCSRGFAKAEHLHRHQRSHTGAKPFSCGQCEQSFTRQDSLNRHQQRQGHYGRATASQPADSYTANPGPLASTKPDNVMEEVPSSSLHSPLAEPPDMADAHVPNAMGMDPFSEVEPLQHDYTDNSFMQLTWPDSEAFLQSILNGDIPSWSQGFEALPSRYLFQSPNSTAKDQQSPWLADSAIDNPSSGTTAVRSISQIISNHSSNLATEAESAALSTPFLEICLHAFFEQMSLVLPVCHRPTFIFRDWTHPLLLNAIALGSLFTGHDIDMTKGELLWTLAHTAVATSWHSLIQHRGPYDNFDGVQLITTALLGQTFAMLSGSAKLRSTAQIFHSLGFYWARQCGLYSSNHPSSLDEPANSSSEEQQLMIWRKWAAEEVQLRALLGHYIIDSQLTYFTGAPTCQRHTSNALRFPSSDRLFMADTLQVWTEIMREEQPPNITFREYFVELFESSASVSLQSSHISFLPLQVILEGLQSLVADFNCVGSQVVGSPRVEAVEAVLYSIHDPIERMPHVTTGEKLQLLLRWHTICIDEAICFNHLCQSLCSNLDVQQSIFGNAKNDLRKIDFPAWTRTRAARKALLHAFEIRSILSELPVRAMHAIHIPTTLFAAAIVCIAFVVGGLTKISLPKATDWSSLGRQNDSSPNEVSEVEVYLSSSGDGTATKSISRNILYDVNSFLLLIKQLRRPWAICSDIGSILQQLCLKCAV